MKRPFQMPKRDPIAKDLRTPKYKMRVVESDKVYKRQPKHRNKDAN